MNLESWPELHQDAFLFESTFCGKNEVSTQANTSAARNLSSKLSVDKKVGVDSEMEMCNGFHGYDSVKEDDELNSLGGVCFKRFSLLRGLMETSHHNDKLTFENKLFLFLMKIKLGLSYCALGVLFGVHRTTVSRIFLAVLFDLAQKTKNFVYWPNRSVIEMTMPRAFKMHYPSCRVIIDCFEVKVEQPKSIDKRIYMYSQYKGAHTAKFLIGIAPNGFVSFISKCYGGRSSDSYITNDSGFLNLLEPDDLVLADKGFPGEYSRYKMYVGKWLYFQVLNVKTMLS